MSHAFWADVLLAVHALVPLFILGGLVAIPLGAWRGWHWVRIRWLRIAHAALMGVVLAQALLGRLCPLTMWEHALRVRAGQADGEMPESFIAYWVGRLLYHDLPPAFFIGAYLGVMLAILALWLRVPPYPTKGTKPGRVSGFVPQRGTSPGRGAGGNRTHE